MISDRRLKLHEILLDIVENVYFQPNENVKLKYPCIIYRRSNGHTSFADNNPYKFIPSYTITIIDKNPDSDLIDKVAALPTATFDRHYTYENLNHDVFVIFY